MYLALVLALAVGSLEGTVVVEEGTLPGCTVTLTAPAAERHTVISDAHGVYAFHGVEPGEYTLEMRLEGFNTEQRQVRIFEGSNELEPVTLSLAVVEGIVGCRKPCSEATPVTVWDPPSCHDYDSDTNLIAAMKNGDHAAIETLRRHYDAAFTYAEKHQIAAALLGRVPDDSLYWTELFAHATDAVRLAAAEPSTSDSYGVALRAFFRIANDPRARPLLLEATQSPNERIAAFAQNKLASAKKTP